MEIVERSERTFMINQFENPANPEVHRRTTAVEILKGPGKRPGRICGRCGHVGWRYHNGSGRGAQETQSCYPDRRGRTG